MSQPAERTSRQPEAAGAGYLCFLSASGEEWAGLLVVAAGGLPQEFLYSGPLRQTPVQTILYQDRLLPEVRLSLVRSLLRGLRSRLALVAVRAEELAPELPEALLCPVLALGGEGGGWLLEPDAAAETLRRHVDEAVGIEEPAGRALAALAYVVEYERSRAESS